MSGEWEENQAQAYFYDFLLMGCVTVSVESLSL